MIFYVLKLEANTLTGFCFPSNVSLNSVKSHVNVILAPQDKVFTRESMNCIELSISQNRIPLFRNWLKKRFQISDEYSVHQNGDQQIQTVSSQNIPSKHCKMEMVRTLNSNLNTTNLGLKKKGTLSNTQTSATGETKSNLMLLSGKKGSVRVNDNSVDITCHYKSAHRYLLDISVNGLDSSLITSVEIVAGQKLNLGDIVKDINRKSRKINSDGLGIEVEKSKGSTTYSYFITIK